MGLMNRVLTSTGKTASDGLLGHALELRRAAQLKPEEAEVVAATPTAAENRGLTDSEKKKPSMLYCENAA